MGVGANPAFWFVAVTIILITVRYFLDSKEVPMKAKSTGRKVYQLKTKILKASLETIWVIAANFIVGFATLSIH